MHILETVEGLSKGVIEGPYSCPCSLGDVVETEMTMMDDYM